MLLILRNIKAPACSGKVDTCCLCHVKAWFEIIDHQDVFWLKVKLFLNLRVEF